MRSRVRIAALAGMAAAALAHPAAAATAILECVADGYYTANPPFLHARQAELRLASRRDIAVISPRTHLVEGWKVTKALLFLHLRSKQAPRRLRLGVEERSWKEEDVPVSGLPRPSRWKSARLVAEREGWYRVEVPLEVAQRLAGSRERSLLIQASEEGVAFGARESLAGSPYLYVEGIRGELRR